MRFPVSYTHLVVKEYENESGKLERIVVVDHFTQTNQDEFKNNKLQDGETLNGTGHFEIGKQFSAATIKSTDGYPGSGVTLNLQEEAQPTVDVYKRQIGQRRTNQWRDFEKSNEDY